MFRIAEFYGSGAALLGARGASQIPVAAFALDKPETKIIEANFEDLPVFVGPDGIKIKDIPRFDVAWLGVVPEQGKRATRYGQFSLKGGVELLMFETSFNGFLEPARNRHHIMLARFGENDHNACFAGQGMISLPAQGILNHACKIIEHFFDFHRTQLSLDLG